ncbi:hypothetical protein M885DRAFT_484881 [Pelagophyceae sp. CCMP2097]|nr:hypothetical protein M885DRAFT_484881 [Pelagophyceae sp. CCMP2097]
MYAGGEARHAGDVQHAVAQYGVAPGGQAMMAAERRAAQEAAATGLYVTWRSPDDAECCRVSSLSQCLCGHALKAHAAVKSSRPPSCTTCSCARFRYCPARPEEVGQWHLPRRKDFDVTVWRRRVRDKCVPRCGAPVGPRIHRPHRTDRKSHRPAEYACLNCDRKVCDHETRFESERDRRADGRAVGAAFMPLAETPQLQQAVFGGEAKGSSLSRRPPAESPEALFERGAISAAEYHQLVAGTGSQIVAPILDRHGQQRLLATNIGARPPPKGPGAYVRKR